MKYISYLFLKYISSDSICWVSGRWELKCPIYNMLKRDSTVNKNDVSATKRVLRIQGHMRGVETDCDYLDIVEFFQPSFLSQLPLFIWIVR